MNARVVACKVSSAERQVADLLPIEVDPSVAMAVIDEVAYWFHTFALNRTAGLYTPGYARDHRYRVPALPESFDGLTVLDIGTFDGFYAFLAEARGADRVVAIDNEQYVNWVSARWGINLEGGEGFRAIKRLLGSHVQYRKLDAFDLGRIDRTFDFIFCCGILHRVKAPGRLLRVVLPRLADGGRVLLETHGVFEEHSEDPVHGYGSGEVYPDDEYVYFGFTPSGLGMLARRCGYAGFEVVATPVIDGHPRLLGWLRR